MDRNLDEADNDCGTHSGPVPVASAATSGRVLVKIMTTLPPFFRYWGKTHGDDYHLLPYHALDVAAVGCEYLTHHPRLRRFLAGALGLPEEHLAQWIGFFLALHDAGKFSEPFQSQQPTLFQQLQCSKEY